MASIYSCAAVLFFIVLIRQSVTQQAFVIDPQNCNGCDADGDGIINYLPSNPNINVDNCQDLKNPNQADYDQDGVGNACDNCPFWFNPDQSITINSTSGVDCRDIDYGPDRDNDTIPDAIDNCPDVWNQRQDDFDGDGVGDRCDDDIDGDGDTNDVDTDADSDGIPNVNDNCPYNYNPYQYDIDGDGVGDYWAYVYEKESNYYVYIEGCDNCYLVANIDQADSDADGFGDLCDNCPNFPNVEQINTDSDGIGDPCDNCPFIPNVNQSDTDFDGIGDVCDENRREDITCGDTSSGTMSIATDIKAFNLTLDPSITYSSVIISLCADLTDFDTYLRVYNASRVLLFEDDNGCNDGNGGSVIEFTPDEGQNNFYIELTPTGAVEGLWQIEITCITPAPTTQPTTSEPTTASPTTVAPTTASPTTFSPTTESPTMATGAPTTASPTTTVEDEPATTDCVGSSSSSSSSSSSDSDTSSSSSSSSSGPCSYSSSSSSSSDSSSEIVVDDDTATARSPWLAAHLTAKRGTDRVWTAQSVNDEDVQTTTDANPNEEDEKVLAEPMEWSIGKTTMTNLWAMLVVCLLGNACICWIANMKKRKENAYFQRNERETIV